METLIIVSLIATVTVTLMSYFAIKHTAHQPANGELKRLASVDKLMSANVEKFGIISQQIKNKPNVKSS